MSSLSKLNTTLTRPGQLCALGVSPASKETVERLLFADAQRHHCYVNDAGFRNHLSRHLLAAFDLGAPPALLQKIYDEDLPCQRPIALEERDKLIKITDENWDQYLGDQHAYWAYVNFFAEKIATAGNAAAVVTTFIFEEDANRGERHMLVRLVSGVLHPFIQIGNAAEFGSEIMIAIGLAQVAVHKPTLAELFKFDFACSTANSEKNLTPLEILQEVNASSLFRPGPYQSDKLCDARPTYITQDGRPEELMRLCEAYNPDVSSLVARYAAGDSSTPTDDDVEQPINDLILSSTLLYAATGRTGKPTRLDLFLLHLLTSSLFLRPFVRLLASNPDAKTHEVEIHLKNLFRAYLTTTIRVSLSRGRPLIRPILVTAQTDRPQPPPPRGGDPKLDIHCNPWSAIIASALRHSDSHVLKAIRSLAINAHYLGASSSLDIPKSLEGAEEVDGTLFVRVAGMTMDYMGWLGYPGQKAREDWDKSGLGWDEAWE